MEAFQFSIQMGIRGAIGEFLGKRLLTCCNADSILAQVTTSNPITNPTTHTAIRFRLASRDMAKKKAKKKAAPKRGKKKAGKKKAAVDLIISKSRTKAAAGINVSGEFYAALDGAVREMIAGAERRAMDNGRKTLRPHDL